MDLGALLLEDCECFENLDEDEKMAKTQGNIC